ncbi:MAG: DUF2147 domain-containing protein [Alphaproteobacteria bacterium]|nr:MAG: DUF2147 domain-containing protein [Alphaproteobacteria bacterium]
MLAVGLFFSATAHAADATGVWSTVENKSHVKIELCGDKLCGRIIWLKEPNDDEGKPKLDKNNTDAELRKRPIIGLKLLSGFVKDGKGGWDDGEIYNPEDGKTYGSSMELDGTDKLDVKGCVLFFCKSQVWTRVE